MGQIISGITRLLYSEPHPMILMLGLDRSGKTTILYRLKLGQVMATIPTGSGFNVETVKIKNSKLTVWDIGYSDMMVPLWSHYYYTDSVGVVFVVDSSDVERIEEASNILSEVLSDEKLKKKPLLVLSNKVDLVKSKNTTEMTDLLCLQKYKDREWFIQETSATTGLGLEEGFYWLAKNIMKTNKG